MFILNHFYLILVCLLTVKILLFLNWDAQAPPDWLHQVLNIWGHSQALKMRGGLRVTSETGNWLQKLSGLDQGHTLTTDKRAGQVKG